MFFACTLITTRFGCGVVPDLLYSASEGKEQQYSLNPPRHAIPPGHERTIVLLAIAYLLDGVTGACGSHASTLSPFIQGW
jgi:hypothetical protein